MDRFPPDFVIHNLPLLLLSGLGTGTQTEPDPSGKSHNYLHEGGFRIRVDAPILQGSLAEQLLHSFCEQDASNIPWHGKSFNTNGGRVFKISCIGRVGQNTHELGSKRRCWLI